MSTQNSSRTVKSFPGNGTDPPHMQSSLSPQGFGLYNSYVGAGDASSIEDSTSIASGLSPLKKQTISYNDYLTSHPQHDSSNVSAAMQDSGWNGSGNENLTAYGTNSNSTGDGAGKSYVNTTTAPSFDSKPFGNLSNGSSNIIDAKALEKSQQQYQQQQHYPSNNSFTDNRTAAMSMGNAKVEHSEFDRDREKDRLIDSLSKSDMITCLPGFKKGPIMDKPIIAQVNGGSGKRFSDKVAPRMALQQMNQNSSVSSSAPISTVRSSIAPTSSYSRQTPATFSPILNYKMSDHSTDGALIPIGSVNGPSTNGNSNVFGSSLARSRNESSRRTPPPSPITRAKDAIGRAQSEISKINSFMENEEDRRKPPGAWKNMGTPFFSEPLTKSAQRQQKAQYRIDLERQILASRMKKAEEERKERDSNDHPLGPEYAHPALTYYNPPQKIFGGSGGTSPTTTTAAITKYIKEKYALDIPASSGGGGITSRAFASGFPQETGFGGSTTALGRIAPLQQTKKEKALANLMKSRMHPGGTVSTENGDQNHGNASRLLAMNQLQSGEIGLHNGMAIQPGNGSRSPPQQQQLQQRQQQQQFRSQQVQAFIGHANPNRSSQQEFYHQQQPQQQQQHPGNALQQHQQHAYPPGTYPPRSYGMNSAVWPMPIVPTYPPYYGAYGQPMYSSANHGPVNPQQQMQQYQQQHLNYQSHPPVHPPSKPRTLRSILHDGNADEDSGDDTEDDPAIDLEVLKEKAYKTQKIWQTSDELPDPGLRTAVYKAELRKQIDEDRKRKAEILVREKEEDERIERKIREFHEEERRRVKAEQQTRAELEGYHRQKVQKQKKRNEVFTVARHPEGRGKAARPRSRSSLLAEKLASFSPDAGDFEDPTESYALFDDNQRYEDDEDSYGFPEKGFGEQLDERDKKESCIRKRSPPVPVVQKKLIENFHLEDLDENRNPRRQISSVGQDFLLELKSKLKSERDLVERRLREKLESTHKNMNLLKYTMNHQK